MSNSPLRRHTGNSGFTSPSRHIQPSNLFSNSQSRENTDSPPTNQNSGTNRSIDLSQETNDMQPFAPYFPRNSLPMSQTQASLEQAELCREFDLSIDFNQFIKMHIEQTKASERDNVTPEEESLSREERQRRRKRVLRRGRAVHDFVLYQWNDSLSCYQYFFKVMAKDHEWMRRFSKNVFKQMFDAYFKQQLGMLDNNSAATTTTDNSSDTDHHESNTHASVPLPEDVLLKMMHCVKGCMKIMMEDSRINQHETTPHLQNLIDPKILIRMLEVTQIGSNTKDEHANQKRQIQNTCLKMLRFSRNNLLCAKESTVARMLLQKLYDKDTTWDKENTTLQRNIVRLLISLAHKNWLEESASLLISNLQMLVVYIMQQLINCQNAKMIDSEDMEFFYDSLKKLRQAPNGVGVKVRKFLRQMKIHPPKEESSAHSKHSRESWDDYMWEELKTFNFYANDLRDTWDSSVEERWQVALLVLFPREEDELDGTIDLED